MEFLLLCKVIKMNLKTIFYSFRTNKDDIDIKDLNKIIKANLDIILLDVRSKQEFNEGHLNAAINIPLYELEACCNCKLKDKNRVIIVYCQSGVRSKKAIKILYKNGFKNLYNLKGGLDGI